MGVHVSLHYKDKREWPGWAPDRHTGDRGFAAFTEGPASERFVVGLAKGAFTYPEDYGYRPKDFAAWRERFVGEDKVNSDRFDAGLTFLETHPGSYISFGN